MESLASLIEVGRGHVLAREGEVGRDFLVIAEGMVKLWKSLPNDQKQIVAFCGPGDLLSLHHCGTAWPITAQAISAAKLFQIEWSALRHLASRYQVLHQVLFDLACDEIGRLQNRLVVLARRSAEQKLATFLVEFCCPPALSSSQSREVNLPMRRSEIADYLGLTTESVSREFSRLRHRRIITMPKPSRVVVLNRSSLEAAAMGTHVRPQQGMSPPALRSLPGIL